jgi:hypothetical protein
MRTELLSESSKNCYFIGQFNENIEFAKLMCKLNDEEVWIADIDYLSVPGQYCLGGSAPITLTELLKCIDNPQPARFYPLIKASIKGCLEKEGIPFLSIEHDAALK